MQPGKNIKILHCKQLVFPPLQGSGDAAGTEFPETKGVSTFTVRCHVMAGTRGIRNLMEQKEGERKRMGCCRKMLKEEQEVLCFLSPSEEVAGRGTQVLFKGRVSVFAKVTWSLCGLS
ncbi:hypothetical protein KIL84_003301 [Mauremys mutica]|uniref:Uncharacterized protein n=1 Tax=Mauremys mutica TaxID=74926 RepID=A0A9D4AR20_9SAUR|nr:hypothetical protein KIL84_003301 [Mauremys mutica]